MSHTAFARSLGALLLVCLGVVVPAYAEGLYERLVSASDEASATQILQTTYGNDATRVDAILTEWTGTALGYLAQHNPLACDALFKVASPGAASRAAAASQLDAELKAKLLHRAALSDFKKLEDRWTTKRRGENVLGTTLAITTGTLASGLYLGYQGVMHDNAGLLSAGFFAGMAASFFGAPRSGFILYDWIDRRIKNRRTARQREWIENAVQIIDDLRANSVIADAELVDRISRFVGDVGFGLHWHRLSDSNDNLMFPIPVWQRVDATALEGEVVSLYQHYVQYLEYAQNQHPEIENSVNQNLAWIVGELTKSNRVVNAESPERTGNVVRHLARIVRRAIPPAAKLVSYDHSRDFETTVVDIQKKSIPIKSGDVRLAVQCRVSEREDKRWSFQMPVEFLARVGHSRDEDIFIPRLETHLGRGYWFRYSELEPQKFWFVPVERLPEGVSEKIGAFEIWRRPWGDKTALVSFPSKRPTITGKKILESLRIPPRSNICREDLALAVPRELTVMVAPEGDGERLPTAL